MSERITKEKALKALGNIHRNAWQIFDIYTLRAFIEQQSDEYYKLSTRSEADPLPELDAWWTRFVDKPQYQISHVNIPQLIYNAIRAAQKDFDKRYLEQRDYARTNHEMWKRIEALEKKVEALQNRPSEYGIGGPNPIYGPGCIKGKI